jgi:Z1 domain
MSNSPEQEQALKTGRTLLDLGFLIDTVVTNPLIPGPLQDWVRAQLIGDTNRTLRPVRVISAEPDRADWLAPMDRSTWYYWNTLRTYLLAVKGWGTPTLRSLDDSSDRILRQLAPPTTDSFDIRGLVLGYVQSGKTASFTALIAKAADAGYRLIIVLSGIDNGLRRQTQLRLHKELVGYSDNRSGAVRLPPVGKQWHQFTSDDFDGDFRSGLANHAALQGSQPVLLVVKKNGPVLRRLLEWLGDSPSAVRASLPALIIDDEADQASIDVRGSHQTEADASLGGNVDDAAEDEQDPDYEAPSIINGLIRSLLNTFGRCAYVAYTATPFANVLIPHDTYDTNVGSDLYPKDFIIDLPKPDGYFGAEEFFGRLDPQSGDEVNGLDVLRAVPPEDIAILGTGKAIPETLDKALHAFVLAGAARAFRGDGSKPATMLVHTRHTVAAQSAMHGLIKQRFSDLRDEWRYQRAHGIKTRLEELWNLDFRPTTQTSHIDKDINFGALESHIGPFFEAVEVREINSKTGEVLDYDEEPHLKAIAIGGNRLARGLTLEGLLVSYFVRRTVMYDTLMQMGRWFGYRGGYEDLTRIYTTTELSGWFADMALVEHRLREDLRIYEDKGLLPIQVGTRILAHPTMQVTGALKRRFATGTTISQTYSAALEQTFKFPFSDSERLSELADSNEVATGNFLASLGDTEASTKFGPMWRDVSAARIIEFLENYSVDGEIGNISTPLIQRYIRQQNTVGELVNWTVVVRGRNAEGDGLGKATWWSGKTPVWNLSRTRIRHTDSMGVITNPGDEALGLTETEELRRDEMREQSVERDENRSARLARGPEHGLLILYPISKASGGEQQTGNREPLYKDASGSSARDLVGLAISFPESKQPQAVFEAYLEGTVAWKPAE